jgi:transcriptional regulator with XRE-family HTH domain
MEERGVDKYALADMTNVSPVTINRWLEGKFQPRFRNLKRVTSTLDVSADYLLGRA